MPKMLYVLFNPRGFLFTAPDARFLVEGFCPWHTTVPLIREDGFGFCPICTEGMSARESEKFSGNFLVHAGYRLVENNIEQILTTLIRQ